MPTMRILKYTSEPAHRTCLECAARSLVDGENLALAELPLKTRSGAQSEIDQFNLGTQVVQLYTNGVTQAEIGVELNLTRDQVQHWLEKYREMSIDQKRSVHKRSIFDLAERLQESFEMIYNELQTQTSNPDLKHKNMSLLLKCIQVGGVFMEKLHQQQDDRRYKAAVLQVMEDMAPGTKAKVQRALSEMDLNQSYVRRL